MLSMARRIAVMGFCYNQLVGHLHDYPIECVERLLQCEKPLETVRGHWMAEQNVDLEAEFDRVFRAWGYKGPESGMNVPGMS